MPKRFGLSFAEWPSVDQALWTRATSAVNFFDENASAAHWRPKSRRQAAYAYGRWLAFLREQYPDSLAIAAADRMTRERAKVFVDSLAGRVSEMSVAAEINHLLLALSVLAPEGDWGWLRQWQSRWQKLARPREKRSKIVHPARLMALGMQLMDEAERATSPMNRARAYRDGLMIALLAARPIRRHSLSTLKVDTNVILTGAVYVVSVDSIDTKSGQAVEYLLPQTLTSYMRSYLADHRRCFPNADRHDGLWPSSKGVPLTADAIYDIICRRTLKHFGFSIHPHLFRDIAATAFARDAPDSMLLARDLLTHVSIDTTSRHYMQANTLEAARLHGVTLDALRPPAQHDRIKPTNTC